MSADHRRAPVLEALVEYRREGRLSFTPPGHKQARGADPPGIPALLPGERLAEPVLRYPRSGLEAGMYLPDPTDPALETIRVVAERDG